MGVFSILQSNRNFHHIDTLTIVIYKSRNLIGTGGIAKFGPKGQVFESNTTSLYCSRRHHRVKKHRATRDSSPSVYRKVPGKSQKKLKRLAGYRIKSMRPILKTKILIYQSKADLDRKILFAESHIL